MICCVVQTNTTDVRCLCRGIQHWMWPSDGDDLDI